MRWVRAIVVGLMSMAVAVGGVTAYRAYHPILRVQTRVVGSPVRAGTVVEVESTGSGRAPVSIRVELIQGTRSATLVLDRIRSRRWAWWNPRPVSHVTRAVVSRATLGQFTAGEAVIRSTVDGPPVWGQSVAPVVDQVRVELEVSPGPAGSGAGAAEPNKELKLTKPCTIGASQLNSCVRRTRGSR
jgi:hypothetical protein